MWLHWTHDMWLVAPYIIMMLTLTIRRWVYIWFLNQQSRGAKWHFDIFSKSAFRCWPADIRLISIRCCSALRNTRYLSHCRIVSDPYQCNVGRYIEPTSECWYRSWIKMASLSWYCRCKKYIMLQSERYLVLRKAFSIRIIGLATWRLHSYFLTFTFWQEFSICSLICCNKI